ncbi:MAG: hypothetical protein R3B45_15390 [Bdellovibrionota bacterium]
MSFNFLKKFFYCFAAILLQTAIIHCQETLYAQAFFQQKLVNQEDLPEVVVMPWRTIGIDASTEVTCARVYSEPAIFSKCINN